MGKTDVLVVGAGIAGLTAARELHASGKSVQVLEARDRVGGRTSGHTLQNGFVVEMGGQWVGPYQTEIDNLIEQLGLATSSTYDAGLNITIHEGEAIQWTSEEGTFGVPESSLYEIGRLIGELEAMAADVPLSRPWETPEARDLDQTTFKQWLESHTSDERARLFFKAFYTGLFYHEPEEMSLLHVLFFTKSNGSLDNILSSSGGLQDARIHGGSHRISERIAEELGEGTVRLNAAVNEIRQHDDGVTISYEGGEASADFAIVAVPLILANQIAYRPPLTDARIGLTNQPTEVSIVKSQILYPSPFWRDAGFSGLVDGVDHHAISIDSSPEEASSGVLACFTVSSREFQFASRSPDERRTWTLGMLEQALGPKASNPIEYVDKVWVAEPFSRGCYGGRFGPGIWTQSGPTLTEPFGRIHWAGTETSDISNGYMDGAVRSGKRAAHEILARELGTVPERSGAVPSGIDSESLPEASQ